MTNNNINKTCITCIVALWCSFLLFMSISLTSHSSEESYQHSSTVIQFNVVDTSEINDGMVFVSPAAKFQHSGQLAHWVVCELVELLFPHVVADAYLFTEPIDNTWLFDITASRFRASGWKDTSLLYKLINGFL